MIRSGIALHESTAAAALDAIRAADAPSVPTVAPGRLPRGVGPSHPPEIEDSYGVPCAHPIGHPRESRTVLQQAGAL